MSRKNSSWLLWLGILAVLFLLFSRVLKLSTVAQIGRRILSVSMILSLALALILILVVIFLVWRSNREDPKVAKAKQALSAGRTEQLSAVLASYINRFGVGPLAENAARQVTNVQMRGPLLLQEVSDKFEPGSITHERFYSPIQAGMNTIIQNGIILASRMESFDAADFKRLARLIESGEYRRDPIDDTIQEERYILYRSQLAEMERIIASSESLLLMLDRISVEMAKLQSSQLSAQSEKLLEEIEELVKTAKYYEKA